MMIMEIFTGFVQRALNGALIAVACSILGVFLNLRRLSLIGDGLAHGHLRQRIAVILIGFSPFYAALAACCWSCSPLWAILQLTRSRRIHGDAAIGIVSSVGIAWA